MIHLINFKFKKFCFKLSYWQKVFVERSYTPSPVFRIYFLHHVNQKQFLFLRVYSSSYFSQGLCCIYFYRAKNCVKRSFLYFKHLMFWMIFSNWIFLKGRIDAIVKKAQMRKVCFLFEYHLCVVYGKSIALLI